MTHTLADFLRRALVWPDPANPLGWVNLHWRMHDRKGITGGQAFKTVEEVLGFIHWSQTTGRDKVADLYYCTSLQKEHGDPKPSGRYSALRSIDNALSSRLLFADVDKYDTKEAAAADIIRFCNASASPFPTALVDSGGGLHSYWILPKPLSKEEWLELAAKFDGLMNQYGLKHDNISTDMARILRPPETLNYKRATDEIPPAPVVLKLLNGDVDLDAWKSLHNATPTPVLARPAVKAQFNSVDIYLNPTVAAGKPSAKAIGRGDNILGGGTVDPDPVLQLCPMFKETLATGGKDVGQPVWHQQALACTFLYNGRTLFHKLGNKHPGYDKHSSDEMFDRKRRDRERIGLGYPSCAAFEADGATQCSTCPLRGKIASPLNARSEPVMEEDLSIGLQEAVLGAVAVAVENSRPPLPENGEFDCNYVYGDDGFIYTVERRGKNSQSTRLFFSKILKCQPFKEERGNSIGIRLTCTSDLGSTVEIDIPGSAFSEVSIGVYRALNQGGCLVMGNPTRATNLMCYFRGRMALEAQASRNVPFGWEYSQRKEGNKQGVPQGFAYGGVVYMPNNKERETYGGDEELQETYCITGTPEPWMNAVRAIQSMKSPGHNAVVLAAFAAPLMIFSGQPSTVVMVRGDTGGSKSTASAVACAVWARPRTGLIKPSSSKLGLMKRMGRIRHLPTIWDDIRNGMFETVKDTLMEITQGGDGLKLDMNRKEREQGIWDNMLLTSSNDSLAEYLEAVSKQDGAALVRCFEFEVPKIHRGDPAYLDFKTLSPLIASLDHNHGHIGREYARVLGSKPSELQEMYDEIADKFIEKLERYEPQERFWLAAAVTILMAGKLVNAMPVMANAKFDLIALEKFLVTTYLAQRNRLAGAAIHADKSQFAKHYLSMFFNNWCAPRTEMVWTIDAPAKQGKPAKTSPLWPVGDAARAMKKVTARWITTTRKLRVSKGALEHYLRQVEKVSFDRVWDGLVKYYGAQPGRARLAAGLDNIAAQGPEQIFEIDVKEGTWLDDILKQHAVGDPPKID